MTRMENTRLLKCVVSGKLVEGAGSVGAQEQTVDAVSSGGPQSFRHQRGPVDDCSPGRGRMAQGGRTRGGTFHGGMDRCSESRG